MGASDRFSRTIARDKISAAGNWKLRPLSGGSRITGSSSLSARGGGSDPEKNAFEAARAQGYAEGLRNAQQAHAAGLQRLDGLLAQLQLRFDELSEKGADALLDLALDVASQVLRSEVQTRRDTVLPVVREALAMVIHAHAHPTVRLAPSDFALVHAALSTDGQLHGCRFLADPAMPVGGCRIESPMGEIDASLPTRWRRVVQTLGANVAAPEIAAPTPAPLTGNSSEQS